MSKEQIKASIDSEVESKELEKEAVKDMEGASKPVSVVITEKSDDLKVNDKKVTSGRKGTGKKTTSKSTSKRTSTKKSNEPSSKKSGVDDTKAKNSADTGVKKSVETKSENANDVKVGKANDVKAEKANDVKAEKANDVKAEKTNDVKAEKANDVKAEKTNAVTAEKTNDVKAEKSNDVKAEKTNDVKAEKSNDVKAEKSNDVKVEKSNDVKAEKSNGVKAENSNDVKAENSEGVKAENSNDVKAEKIVDNGVGDSVQSIESVKPVLNEEENLRVQAERAFNIEYDARDLISTPEGKKRAVKADRVLDALDLDILASQRAKEIESWRIEQYKRKEAEALSKVNKQGEERRAYLEELRRKTREAAEKREQQVIEQGETAQSEPVLKNESKSEPNVKSDINAYKEHTVFDMAYIRYIIVGIVVICVCIVGLIIGACKKSETEYRDFYNQKLLSKIVSSRDVETGSSFVDSDIDRLSDIEEEKLGTDPYKADTDGDGVIDGVEVYYGFDPLVADNFENGVEIISTTENCKVSVTGDKNVFDLRLAKIDSASLRGTIGIVSDIYSIADLKGEAYIEIGNVKGTGSKMLAKYTVDKFEPLSCNVTDEVVSAKITEPGVYCVIDSNKYAPYSGYDIMFLIDNSGSMYSAEDCANSDENDVDFKRVDFVAQFINTFDDENTRYAVATFTRDYYSLYDYTGNKGEILSGLSSIKAPENMPYFNGTDIESALSNVLNKVDNSRRNIIVLITDGMNTDKITTITQDDVIAKCADSNTTIITVALGNQVDKDALMYYVNSTNGIYARLSNATEFDKAMESLLGYLDQKKHKVEFSKMLDDVEPEDSLELLATANSYFKPEKDTLGIRWLNVDDTDMTRGYALFISQYKAGKLSFDNRINVANVINPSALSDYRMYTDDLEPWDSYENTASIKAEYRNKQGLRVVKKPYSDDIYVWSGWASIQNLLHKNKNITEFEYLTIDTSEITDVSLQHVLSNIANFNTANSKPLVERSQLLNCVLSLREGVPVPAETKYGVGLITKMYQDVEDGTVYALQFYSIKDKDFYNIRLYDYYGDLVYDTVDDFINIIDNTAV